jgi:hypothetical protein
MLCFISVPCLDEKIETWMYYFLNTLCINLGNQCTMVMLISKVVLSVCGS